MQIGPLKISINGDPPYGAFLRRNGAEQDVTIPAIVIAVVALSLLCCCARIFL